jgi:hypothetical protein
MGVSVASLIAGTRVDSGLRNNRLFSDDQIAEKLTDAYADLRDKMIVRFAYWFKKTYQFSLTGGLSGNVLTLSDNIPDLEMVQGLNLLDSQGNPQTVDMLSSFAERNQWNSNYPFMMGNGFNGYVGRRYFIDGDDLEILPAANSSGNYELIYTPQPQRLALPITIDVPDLDDSSTIVEVGGSGLLSYVLPDMRPLNDGMIGGTLIIDFDAPNAFASAPSPGVEITNVQGGPTGVLTTDLPFPGTSFTNPCAGSASLVYQPTGTIGELPEALTPWAKYLQLHASIAIRTSRRQPTAALDRQLQVFEKRIIAITKQRSQGVTQAPITRTNYGGFGNGFSWNG